MTRALQVPRRHAARVPGRRTTFPGLAFAAVALFAIAPAAAALAQAIAGSTRVTRSDPAVQVTAVGPVGMTVSNMERAVDFYTTVLSFEKVSDLLVEGAAFEKLQGVPDARARVVQLQLGDERIELTQYLTPRGRAVPAHSRSNDGWFQHVAIIVSDMDRAYAILQANHVQGASTAPQRLPNWNPNAGGIEAYYFKDPDKHVLEILHFPAGKGLEKWHAVTDRLFLGIDHTAIVARDTEASLAFYRDLLGLRIAGTSENWGIEQERLNNVTGAHLRITALRAAQGPGIELLEYLSPRDGRSYPADAHASDLFHWQTRLFTVSVDGAAAALRQRVTWLSPGASTLPDNRLGFYTALTVRDPDGHAMQLAERN